MSATPQHRFERDGLRASALHAAARLDDHVGQRFLRRRVIAVHVEQLKRRELRARAARHHFQAPAVVVARRAAVVHEFLRSGRETERGDN